MHRNVLVATAASALLCAFGCTKSDLAPTPNAAEAGMPSKPVAAKPASKGPVLVELFTSQGCSSCPPADRVLTKIGDGEFGDDVIPLAFHVDYWNYIGWSDPFSKKKWSELQRRYGKKIADGRVYTPMLVVGGTSHLVGSRPSEARREIERARAAGARTSIALLRTKTGSDVIGVELRWGPLEDADLFIVVTESGLATDVSRGENSGRELRNDHIVREMIRVKPEASERSRRIDIPLAPKWQRNHLKLVAFARDRASLAILAAATE